MKEVTKVDLEKIPSIGIEELEEVLKQMKNSIKDIESEYIEMNVLRLT